jgi:hypothetical protein
MKKTLIELVAITTYMLLTITIIVGVVKYALFIWGL